MSIRRAIDPCVNIGGERRGKRERMEEGGKKREMRGGAKARGRKGKEAHDRVDRDGSRRRPRYVPRRTSLSNADGFNGERRLGSTLHEDP